jgi:PilZ domain-containing protein
MKRLVDLTVGDLTASPVWRYEGGSSEDALVVAEDRDSLSQRDEEILLAATEFVLGDSSEHLGFCFPVDGEGIDYLQPVIVAPAMHVRFWFDGSVAPEVLAAQWKSLGKKEEEIFPVRFSCRVPVDGRTVSGVIPRVATPASAAPVSRSPREPAGEPPEPRRSADGSGSRAPSGRARRLVESRAGIPEKRRAPRHRVEMLVEFDVGDSWERGVTGEISRSGMFVRSQRIPNVGPAVNLTVHLPSGRELLLKGRVVPASDDPAQPAGFGVRLTEKPDEYDNFLTRIKDSSR